MGTTNPGNIDYGLQNSDFPANGGATTTPFGIIKTPQVFILAFCNGVPANSLPGFAPGCLCINTSTPARYYNAGSVTSSTWTAQSAN